MNKLKIIFIVSILLMSCDDLDRLPQSSLAVDEFFQTETHAIQAVNGIYNVLRDLSMYDSYFLQFEGVTDNALSAFLFWGFLEISENQGWDASSSVPFSFWSKSYEGIVRANQVITNVPDMEINQGIKNRILGEARFLRALFYFHLTNLWGDVPLILEIQKVGEEALVSRDPKAQVVAQIKNDLDFAIEHLPISYPSSELGRVTKGAAIALKSRVHLYQKEWADVISTVNEVTLLGYDLLPTEEWPSQFLPEGNNNTTESIFEVQFQGGTGSNTSNGGMQQGSIPQVTGSMGLYPLSNLADAFEDGDPRKEWTVLSSGEEFAGITFNPALQDPNFQSTGFGRVKGVIPEINLSEPSQNFVVIRYAEMLLNRAEAENELNGPAGAYDPINRIRNRVGLSDLPAGLSQAEMRAAIKKERRLELAFEGHYYFDLLRWGPEDMQKSMESVVSVSGHIRTFGPRVMMWPVPQRELDVNPNLTQNPGW